MAFTKPRFNVILFEIKGIRNKWLISTRSHIFRGHQ